MTKDQVYLNHIKRLKAENKLLLEMVLEERKMRIQAWCYVRKKLQSKIWTIMQTVLFMADGIKK